MQEEEWRRKARQNLRAAEELVNFFQEDSETLTYDFGNPIASRTYYSAFQTVVASMIKLGVTPDQIGSSEGKWSHGILRPACKSRLNDTDLATLIEDARSEREKADYGPGDVSQQEAVELLADVRERLRRYGLQS